ncbi:MAG: Gfo/Idh/MocA family protein [Betaproteobacteria bacterium]
MVSFGLIGCGRVARYHAEALTRIPGVKLRAVCDLVPERAEEFARRWGGEPYTDYRFLLDRNDIDVVSIATPSGDHPRIGVDAALAGKHVVVEKPIGLTLAEIDALIRTCREQGVKLCVVHQNRFNPAVRKLHEALSAGRFGRLSHAAVAVRWNRGNDYYEQARWRGTWAQDGGVLMNQSVHALDIFRWMMGEPAEVFAFAATQLHAIAAEDVAVASVRFLSQALGVVEASNNVFPANWEETIALFGERGSAALGGVALNRIERWEFADSERRALELEADIASQPDPASVYGSGHGALLAAMAEAIRTDGPPPVSGEEGRAAVELILSVYRSVETGEAVKFPLQEESERILSARRGEMEWLNG